MVEKLGSTRHTICVHSYALDHKDGSAAMSYSNM